MKKLLLIAGIIVIVHLTGCSQPTIKQKTDVKGMKETAVTKIERLLESKKFNGATYIIKDNKILLNKAYGYKSNKKLLLKNDDMFLMGSAEKFLTGIIVRKLEDEGKINRNEQVSYYLPQFTGMNITVKDLLMHHSGLKSINTNRSAIGLNSTVDKIAAQGIDSKYYHQYHYNDVNYIVLARIIEVASQQSYEQNLQRYITTPLKLKQLASYQQQNKQSYFVEGFVKGTKKAVKPFGLDQYIGAGSHYISAEDLGRITDAYVHGRIFPQDETKLLMTNVDGNIQPYRYGYRVEKNRIRVRGVFYGQEVVGWASKKLTVILATNTFNSKQPKKTEELVKEIFSLLSN